MNRTDLRTIIEPDRVLARGETEAWLLDLYEDIMLRFCPLGLERATPLDAEMGKQMLLQVVGASRLAARGLGGEGFQIVTSKAGRASQTRDLLEELEVEGRSKNVLLKGAVATKLLWRELETPVSAVVHGEVRRAEAQRGQG